MTDVFIYDTLRTPCGKGNENGALFEAKPIKLLSSCLSALQTRNQLDTNLVEDLIVGCMTPTGEQGDNIAKTALLYTGWSDSVAGAQINRFQASGLSALSMAAAKIKSGWATLMIAGGLESSSRIQNNRTAISSDPDIMNRMGWVPSDIAADLLATKEGFSKEELAEYAFHSHQKAVNAQANDYFKKTIIPIFDQNNILLLDKDEWINPEVLLEELLVQELVLPKSESMGFEAMALKTYPLVERIIPAHSEGSIAPSADSAALIMLGNQAQEKVLQIKARAKIVAVATVSSEPNIVHLGGIEAADKALKNAKLKPKDIDLWAVNETYAATALHFQKIFNISNKKLNPSGGTIAFGDPLGATGIMLVECSWMTWSDKG